MSETFGSMMAQNFRNCLKALEFSFFQNKYCTSMLTPGSLGQVMWYYSGSSE